MTYELAFIDGVWKTESYENVRGVLTTYLCHDIKNGSDIKELNNINDKLSRLTSFCNRINNIVDLKEDIGVLTYLYYTFDKIKSTYKIDDDEYFKYFVMVYEKTKDLTDTTITLDSIMRSKQFINEVYEEETPNQHFWNGPPETPPPPNNDIETKISEPNKVKPTVKWITKQKNKNSSFKPLPLPPDECVDPEIIFKIMNHGDGLPDVRLQRVINLIKTHETTNVNALTYYYNKLYDDPILTNIIELYVLNYNVCKATYKFFILNKILCSMKPLVSYIRRYTDNPQKIIDDFLYRGIIKKYGDKHLSIYTFDNFSFDFLGFNVKYDNEPLEINYRYNSYYINDIIIYNLVNHGYITIKILHDKYMINISRGYEMFKLLKETGIVKQFIANDDQGIILKSKPIPQEFLKTNPSINTKYNISKNYKYCRLCGKQYTKEGSLLKHESECGGKIKPYIYCKHCGKQYAKSVKDICLKKHERDCKTI